MKARTEARDKNIAQSKTDVDAFFAEHGLDEAEQKQFVEWVDNEILANLLDGKVNKGILTKLYQGWIYDAAVADALETGKVEVLRMLLFRFAVSCFARVLLCLRPRHEDDGRERRRSDRR